MKKLIALAMAALLCLVSCVSVGSFSSAIFNADEYKEAVEVVNENFKGFKGATMKEISYAGDDAVKAEAESRGVGADCIIVLESTFVTDPDLKESPLEPGHTYEHYKWILTRSAPGFPWEHKDHGYG